jgi:hypothetical protein
MPASKRCVYVRVGAVIVSKLGNFVEPRTQATPILVLRRRQSVVQLYG